MRESMMRVAGPISAPEPIRLSPSRNASGCRIVSGPIRTSTSMNVVSGSRIVTPFAMCRALIRSRMIRSTTAIVARASTPAHPPNSPFPAETRSPFSIRLPGRSHSVPGPNRLALADEDRLGPEAPGPHGLLDLFGSMPNHDHQPTRPCGHRRPGDMPQGRPAPYRLQDLGELGLQPLALARGEQHRGEGRNGLLGHGHPSSIDAESFVPGPTHSGKAAVWDEGFWKSSGGRSRTSIEGSKGPRLAVRPPRTASDYRRRTRARPPPFCGRSAWAGDDPRRGPPPGQGSRVALVASQPRKGRSAPAHHGA